MNDLIKLIRRIPELVKYYEKTGKTYYEFRINQYKGFDIIFQNRRPKITELYIGSNIYLLLTKSSKIILNGIYYENLTEEEIFQESLNNPMMNYYSVLKDIKQCIPCDVSCIEISGRFEYFCEETYKKYHDFMDNLK